MNKRLETLIKNFLATRSKSTGGWAPVTEDDLDQLGAIITNLINTKYEADPDGARPVQFKLIDRTKYEPDHFFLVQYAHKLPLDDRAVLLEEMSLRVSNAKIATDRLHTFIRLAERTKIAQPSKED